MVWTSCSYRRITGPDGKEGGVLHAYNQRSDGHPDLSMPEDQLFALVRLRNALPALIAENRRLKTALEKIAHPPYGLGFNRLRGIARATLREGGTDHG